MLNRRRKKKCCCGGTQCVERDVFESDTSDLYEVDGGVAFSHNPYEERLTADFNFGSGTRAVDRPELDGLDVWVEADVFDVGGADFTGVTIGKYTDAGRLTLRRHWSVTDGYELRYDDGTEQVVTFTSDAGNPIKLRVRDTSGGAGTYEITASVGGAVVHTVSGVALTIPATLHLGVTSDGQSEWDDLAFSPCIVSDPYCPLCARNVLPAWSTTFALTPDPPDEFGFDGFPVDKGPCPSFDLDADECDGRTDRFEGTVVFAPIGTGTCAWAPCKTYVHCCDAFEAPSVCDDSGLPFAVMDVVYNPEPLTGPPRDQVLVKWWTWVFTSPIVPHDDPCGDTLPPGDDARIDLVRYWGEVEDICGPMTVVRDSVWTPLYERMWPETLTFTRVAIPDDENCALLSEPCCEPSQYPCVLRATAFQGAVTSVFRMEAGVECRKGYLDDTTEFTPVAHWHGTIEKMPWCPCAPSVNAVIACIPDDTQDPPVNRFAITTDGGRTWVFASSAQCENFALTFTGVDIGEDCPLVTIEVDGAFIAESESWPEQLSLSWGPPGGTAACPDGVVFNHVPGSGFTYTSSPQNFFVHSCNPMADDEVCDQEYTATITCEADGYTMKPKLTVTPVGGGGGGGSVFATSETYDPVLIQFPAIGLSQKCEGIAPAFSSVVTE